MSEISLYTGLQKLT